MRNRCQGVRSSVSSPPVGRATSPAAFSAWRSCLASNCFGAPFSSGATVSASHNWSDFGSVVKIKVRARDIFYEYSPWSDTITRVIPGFEFIVVMLAFVLVFVFMRRKHQNM